MNVLLIQPPNKHITPIVEPKIVMSEVGLYPPLGLLYIAAFLKKHTPHQVRILDTVTERLDYEEIRAKIHNFKPHVVGIQTITQTLVDATKVARVVKEIDKDIHVCMGGPHPSLFPTETINFPFVDSIIVGEGEHSFTELVETLADGKNPAGIKGVVFKDSGKVVNNGIREWNRNLDELPFPARELIQSDRYYSILEANSPMTTMMSARGCPFDCIYCLPFERNIYRTRSPKNVVDEMEACVREGYKDIFFWDTIFTIKRQRVIDICDEVLKRGLKLSWSIRARVNTTDEAMLERLKEAGCERIQYGIEASSDNVLNTLRKRITAADAKKAITMAKKYGFTTYGDFMIGSPGETRDDILKTISFASELDLDYANFAVTTPYPDTELYRLGLKKGLYKKDYWADFAKNPQESFVPEVWEENVSREELNNLLTLAYRSFYLKPRYILKRLAKLKSSREFYRQARTALKMLNPKMLKM